MEPASIRTRNPGAMWGKGNKIADKWGSTETITLNDGKGQGNNIAVFPTYVQGICAQLDLWRTSAHYKNKRFADAIAVWSGGNDVEVYIAYVLKRVPGMTRGTVMDDAFWRGPMCIPFLKEQAAHEAGKPYPAPDADWVEAQRRVFSGQPIGGTAAKASTSTAIATGTAIVIDKAARKPVSDGIDWMLAIPILVVGLSIAAVAWFVWPKKQHEAAP